ncbi:TIGR02757 family protein [Helicobacter sp. 11S03491-1]|uniref:TIGR02757 family protein n=1 Tax=Helicobacter sp. 11S03491-1 TaxID=1476196 RepID=UPI000BA73D38|nr:TIGR02757 family protein [Helicobacter sp. 11S03491-1]PAF42241.1 TIGR02757 family protein [Helicobacter sp. 11S03491-1]
MIKNLKKLLDNYYELKNNPLQITQSNPDPLLVVRDYRNHEFFEEIALICALLSYGNAKQILSTLQKLDFSLLNTSVACIQKASFPFYRFQTSADIKNLFIAIYQTIHTSKLKNLIIEGYHKHQNVIDGIHCGIYHLSEILEKSNYKTKGIDFLLGKIQPNPKGSSPLKRWNMFLRWMVRKDNLDFGVWQEIHKAKLVLPLDTHTFRICTQLDLLQRKTYDLYAALLATQSLRRLDPLDPVKYDFALYRMGQEKTKIQN